MTTTAWIPQELYDECKALKGILPFKAFLIDLVQYYFENIHQKGYFENIHQKGYVFKNAKQKMISLPEEIRPMLDSIKGNLSYVKTITIILEKMLEEIKSQDGITITKKLKSQDNDK